ncbi:hypothetical protein NKI15_22480 [Mesorhizobium sp. M0862]|uniref:hypothetical protein n=1 Tax=Mesorhizobium sp. M0862 TaxID=2957015 RepID=UPI003335B9D9
MPTIKISSAGLEKAIDEVNVLAEWIEGGSTTPMTGGAQRLRCALFRTLCVRYRAARAGRSGV